MALSPLPLCYCTNVHAGRTLRDVLDGLDSFTVPVARHFGEPLAAGLWLAAPVVAEILSSKTGLRELKSQIAARNLTCHTLNAFPYGDFHSERVKENVYLPDWANPKRLQYTLDCANILTTLLPRGVDGSLSTVPLGFKVFSNPSDFRENAADALIELARKLAELAVESGRRVRLAIEPEPFCLLETTDETIEFFEFLWDRAPNSIAVENLRNHIGVCYDICHQAVEFEDVADSIRRLDKAGIRINKVHISCAIKLDHPADNHAARQELTRYVEPRYLHQTTGRLIEGQVVRAVDLTHELALAPPGEFLAAEEWRVHYHVPVNAERLGPLKTTRNELRQALQVVAGLHYAPHLEVETYTWEVLPDGVSANLVDGLTAELRATRELLNEIESAEREISDLPVSPC